MTTRKTRCLPALLLPLLLLATACDSGPGVGPGPVPVPPETVPGAFAIHSTQAAVNDTLHRGTFEASGMLADRGTVREVLDAPAPLHQRGNISGAKTLESEKGTIEIQFYVNLSRIEASTWSPLRAVGGFYITGGTGAYADLSGSGEIDLEVAANASPAELTRVLEGIAHYTR